MRLCISVYSANEPLSPHNIPAGDGGGLCGWRDRVHEVECGFGGLSGCVLDKSHPRSPPHSLIAILVP